MPQMVRDRMQQFRIASLEAPSTFTELLEILERVARVTVCVFAILASRPWAHFF